MMLSNDSLTAFHDKSYGTFEFSNDKLIAFVNKSSLPLFIL
ncbi:Uncharacterised protein [Streptococcus pyogenes]|nr:Uncharacterised protein [Streptococcus pyogenes]VGQ63734.1 Uncharacterised protein [Streptococcus pyogenes]VGR07219.1 Uncharacterised protein [Streptococcus pyogenes]VGR40964.1 Uncharacterised protein [Streptococcus pyogenes]VGR41167.1 Uncharacterised protein [Streptococcus pyogenes]